MNRQVQIDGNAGVEPYMEYQELWRNNGDKALADETIHLKC